MPQGAHVNFFGFVYGHHRNLEMIKVRPSIQLAFLLKFFFSHRLQVPLQMSRHTALPDLRWRTWSRKNLGSYPVRPSHLMHLAGIHLAVPREALGVGLRFQIETQVSESRSRRRVMVYRKRYSIKLQEIPLWTAYIR